MTYDLKQQLRDLANCRHDDMSIGYEAADRIEQLEAELDQLRAELETEQMRNVACGVVAMADTPDSAKQARNMHQDYMSAACSDVARRVDECIQLREQVKMLSAWIKQQGEITDTCTFHLLREVCENCACHRNKVLAATKPK